MIVAADRLLQQDPFGPAELFSAVDPAAVAAAHWLAAAAEVAAETSGEHPTQVVLEADTIEVLPHETPTLVLGLLQDGATPHEAVTALVRHAMHITDGLLLDPKRPARDLLEDLLPGIHGRWLLRNASAEPDEDEDLGDAEDWDAEQAEEHQRRSHERFARLVRETAATHSDRLI
ncbi:hypothetical protein [Kitasatospora phosalacinea]|uniref:Uncharacterized protein n=1 Tax=Kitasatospora phosalacinea TaxID=2065 RepID=A0ABW6GJR5_9ACTN